MMRFVAVNRRTLLQLTGALAAGAALRPWRASGQDPKVLRVRSYSDLQVLDPLDRLAQPEGDIMDAIFSNLVKAKPGEIWDWQLDAAELIEQIDDTHIDFTLRQGIQFTDGFGELTADDVKYSFERIADPKNELPYRDDWAVLDHVEVKDRYSGTIVLKEPFAPLWTISLVRGSGSILSQEGDGSRSAASSPPSRRPASGPYVLQGVAAQAEDDSRAQPGLLRAPRPISTRSTSTRSRTRRPPRSRSRRASWTTPRSACRSLPALQANLPADARIVERPAMSYVWLGMNVDNPALAGHPGAPGDPEGGRCRCRARGRLLRRRRALHRDHRARPARASRRRATQARPRGRKGAARPRRARSSLDSHARSPEQDRAHLGRPGDPGEPRRGRHQRRRSRRTIPAPSGRSATRRRATAGRTSSCSCSASRCSPDPSFATAWFTPEQIGVWNWERFNSPEFGELHTRAIVEIDPDKRARDVRAHAGPDGGVGRVRLPHPRAERRDLPRPRRPGPSARRHRALRRVQSREGLGRMERRETRPFRRIREPGLD